MFKNLFKKYPFIPRYIRERLYISLSLLGIIIFILIAVFFPFKDKLFSLLYPKPSSEAEEINPLPQAEFISNVLLVKFKKDIRDQIKEGNPEDSGIPSIDKLHKDHKVKKFEKTVKPAENSKADAELFSWYKITLENEGEIVSGRFDQETGQLDNAADKTSNLQSLIDDLRKEPHIQQIEPDYVIHAQAVPNDPYYADYQYSLKKISPESAWDQTTGSNSIVVAVIDSGIDRDHEDLQNNMWTNPRETANNGQDDDNNGYTDDYFGWDFNNNDSDPMDEHGHGTFVTGIIGAVGNNSLGMAGINWRVKIMALRVLGADGQGLISRFATALKYAADNGAKVANNSLGCYCGVFQGIEEDAVKYAHDNGMVVVASAGNSSVDALDLSPASAPGAITVSAATLTDDLWIGSNFGEKIDVAAPSSFVLSLKSQIINPDMQLGCSSPAGFPSPLKYCLVNLGGTSAAGAYVSGLAALILARNPNLSNEQIRQIIRRGSDDVGPAGKDQYFGYGRINAQNAIRLTDSNPLAPEILNLPNRSTISGTYQFTGVIPGGNFANFTLEAGPGRNPSQWIPLVQNSTSSIPVAGVLTRYDTTQLGNGVYTIRLTAFDTSANQYQFEAYDITVYNRFSAVTSGCSGNISLTFNPSVVSTSSSVTPVASGLANCSGQSIIFVSGTCQGGIGPPPPQVSSCTSGPNGCNGTPFTTPDQPGYYYYCAEIDKSADGSFFDVAGERAYINLKVGSPTSAAFGYSGIGSDQSTDPANQWGTRYEVFQDGQVSSITAYLKWDGTGSNNVKAVIYDSSEKKRGESQIVTFTTTPSWVSFPFSPAVSLTAGKYTLSILAQESGVYGYYYPYQGQHTGGRAVFFKDNAPYPAAMDPLSASRYDEALDLSIYASYTPTATATPPPPIIGLLTSGLVNYWAMDETSWINDCSTLTVIDSVGQNKGKSCPASKEPATLVKGKFGNAALFDGVDDYVDLGKPQVAGGGQFTLTAWINLSKDAGITTPTWFDIANPTGADFAVANVNGSNFVGVSGYGIGVTRSSLPLSLNTWYFVTLVVVGGEKGSQTVYVNGTNAATKSGNIPLSDYQLLIGSAGGQRFFNGLIDDVQIYNRALSQAEIQSLYNFVPAAPTPAPISSSTYTLSSEYSSTQGPRWYYYFRDQNSTVNTASPAIYGTSAMKLKEWFGGDSQYYHAGGYNWMALGHDINTAGDTQNAIVYFKAPSKGTAEVTVTEQRIEPSGKGNGFAFGLGYVASVGQWSNPLKTGIILSNNLSQNSLTLTLKMQGNGDAIFYYKDSRSWTYGDASRYSIQVKFTPSP